MKVRVFDKSRGTYFRSEVYAVIDSGWYERQLVLVPSNEGGYFQFFDYLDKDGNKPVAPVLINTIVYDQPDEWICKKLSNPDEIFREYKGLINNGVRFFHYCGSPWLFEEKNLLTKLLNGEIVLCKGSDFEKHLYSSGLDGWTYIETQKDIQFLLDQTSGFHDSVIKQLSYTSGYSVDENKTMHLLNLRTISLSIDSQWCESIEMVFEGVTALNLRPAIDNSDGTIFGASLFIENECLFFADQSLNKPDESYPGTWISAYGLRWRFN